MSKHTTEVPRNMTELRDDLAKLYSEIRNAQIKPEFAKEACNAAGKIIKSAAVQVDYASLRKETPEIPFLK